VNVVSVAMRDPVLLAKQCATIDVLSQGRLLPGFGIGSPRGPEWTAMHLDASTRGKRTDEALEIIARLWAGEKLDYAGKHFRLTGASISPVPVQPDLPMWIGGASEAAVRRTAKYGTGWQAGPETPAQVAEVVAAIRTAATAAGRTIDEDHYGAAFAFRFGRWSDPGMARVAEAYKARTGRDAAEAFAVGGVAEVMARLSDYVGPVPRSSSCARPRRGMGTCWRRRGS
jgi:alkanesulfonate monooxygenase SsuD/methylene tetrahydromethanopterin reductase-like flavin-dependent oxidoreductase (luciferase family)